VLRETTSRGLCGLVCPSRTGTREEPGILSQGAPVFPGSSRLGIEPKTPGWLVQDPTTRPIGDLIPLATIGGSGSPPRAGLCVECLVGKCVCFITAGPITKLFAWGGGIREEPGTLSQGAPVFPGSSRLGIEPKTPGWLVQDSTTRPIGDLIPLATIGGSGSPPRAGLCVECLV
jgi:hypothetical protein